MAKTCNLVQWPLADELLLPLSIRRCNLIAIQRMQCWSSMNVFSVEKIHDSTFKERRQYAQRRHRSAAVTV